jgi:hypothetical protein
MKINNSAEDFIECIVKDSFGVEKIIFVENIILLQKPETNCPIEKQVQYDLSKPYIKDLPKPKILPPHKRSLEALEKYNTRRALWEKNKRDKDLLFKLTKDTRSLIRSSFKSKGLIKNSKTELILGCTLKGFKLHIETQFENWMTWDNHGVYSPIKNTTWQLDHIIPLETAKTEDDIIKLNHYSNLRPLCSKENSERRYQK